MDPRCFLAVTEWVPEKAWKRAEKHSAINKFLDAFTENAKKQIPDGWHMDLRAHHGPLRPNEQGRFGVTMVFRAWRIAPTKSGVCDQTCNLCLAQGAVA